MFFFEFNGLPGCGKSTIVKKVTKELNEKGFNIILLEDLINFKKNFFENKIVQLVNAFFNLHCLKFNYFTIKIAFECGISIERIRFAMRLIKLNYQIRRVYKMNDAKGEKILLLDEGFIQFITSIPHNKKIFNDISIKGICQYIVNEYPSIQIVNCLLPIDETIIRSKNRKSSISRFDNLSSGKLKEQLHIKLYNIQLVQKYLSVKDKIEVDFTRNIDENSEYIMDYIEKTMINSKKKG